MPRTDKLREKQYYEDNKERIKQVQKQWRDANKEKLRAAKRKRNYGLTQEQYDQMLKDQNKACEICEITTDQLALKYPSSYHKNLVVDHCHYSGKVRSLLCHHCNLFVGYLESKQDVLQKAVEYIDEHKR